MTAAIPIIDLAPLYGGGAEGTRAVAEAIGAACRGIGFFYVVNASVPPQLRSGVFEASKTFFAAEAGLKDAVSIRRSPHNRGYVGMAVEALDPAKAPDLKEAFNVGFDLRADDPEVLEGKPFRGVNLWPDLPGFRETCLAYYDALWSLGRDLHRAIAIDLGLEMDTFDPFLERPLATLRLLHYPPAPVQRVEGQLGAGVHTDYGNLTLLAVDEVGGLQAQTRDGAWIDAPSVPGAFICNIGDLLMRWTNDIYVSTPHRVVNPTGRERFSVAFFLDPHPDARVSCLPTCRGAGGAERYPPITAAAYLQQRLDATYRV